MENHEWRTLAPRKLVATDAIKVAYTDASWEIELTTHPLSQGGLPFDGIDFLIGEEARKELEAKLATMFTEPMGYYVSKCNPAGLQHTEPIAEITIVPIPVEL